MFGTNFKRTIIFGSTLTKTIMEQNQIEIYFRTSKAKEMKKQELEILENNLFTALKQTRALIEVKSF